MANLPYVTASGNIKKALDGISKAATPAKVSQDFVKTVLNISGGSGDQMTSFLKKLGLANPDGTPTPLYNQFRNSTTSKQAIAAAIRHAYAPLYLRNEYMHELNDNDLRGLIVEETGQAHDSNSVNCTFSCIKQLKHYADFSNEKAIVESPKYIEESAEISPVRTSRNGLGLNLGYTINLNLPATTDVAVFNAIFKSLKEHLLSESDA